MILNTAFFNNYLLIATAFAGAFIVALWISLIIWTYRDISNRARDPLLRILATLVVVVLFLPGVLIYLILRPPRTLEEEYERSLEEEALLQTIENNPLCPGCSRHVQEDWLACPNCHTRLKKACPHCGKLIELPWDLCPYCASPTLINDHEDAPMDEELATSMELEKDLNL